MKPTITGLVRCLARKDGAGRSWIVPLETWNTPDTFHKGGTEEVTDELVTDLDTALPASQWDELMLIRGEEGGTSVAWFVRPEALEEDLSPYTQEAYLWEKPNNVTKVQLLFNLHTEQISLFDGEVKSTPRLTCYRDLGRLLQRIKVVAIAEVKAGEVAVSNAQTTLDTWKDVLDKVKDIDITRMKESDQWDIAGHESCQ